MENFKIRINEFKKFSPTRKGLVIEFNGEGIIGIVPSSEESESFILFENGSRRIITGTESSDFQFNIPDFDDDIRIEFRIGEGLEIMIYNDKNEKDRSYFIPVKSDWTVEFRNRRACGKTRIKGNSVWLNLSKKVSKKGN